MDTDICDCGYTRSKHTNSKHLFDNKQIAEQKCNMCNLQKSEHSGMIHEFVASPLVIGQKTQETSHPQPPPIKFHQTPLTTL